MQISTIRFPGEKKSSSDDELEIFMKERPPQTFYIYIFPVKGNRSYPIKKKQARRSLLSLCHPAGTENLLDRHRVPAFRKPAFSVSAP